MERMQLSKDRLEDIGILSLLADDDRPTFILERSAPHLSGYLNSQIAYRNAALEAFIREASIVTDFEDWARTLSVDTTQPRSWRFVGRAWTSTTISRRWLVVYCSQVQHIVQQPLSGKYMRESVGPAYRARNTSISINGLASPISHKPSQDFSDSGDTVPHALDVAPSFPTLVDDGVTEPKIIDWTRHHIEVPDFIQFFKNYDFAATSLGPLSSWPDDLRRLVVCMFSNPDPRVILYGPNLALIYNEAAVVRVGSKHPWAMGRPASEAFAEIWPQVAPLIRPAIFDGKAIKVVKELFFMERDAMLEETYWNFIMSPILGDNGYACGALDSFSEITMTVIIQRRRDMVVRMTQETSSALTLKQLWQKFLISLEDYGTDAPYAIVFASDENETATSSSSLCSGTRTYTLEGTLGIPADCPDIPQSFDLGDPVSDSQDQCLANACRRAWEYRDTIILQTEDGSLPDGLRQASPGRGWGDAVRTVLVMTISTTASGPLAFLVLAFNPRRPYNEESLRFGHSLRDTLARSAWRIGQSRFEEIHDALALQVRVSSLEAARNEEKFTKLAEASPVGICTFGGDGRTLYVNDEYLRLIGIPRAFDNKTLWESNAWQNEVVPSDLEVISKAWDNLIQRKVTSTTIEYRSKRPWRSIDKATGREMVGETWLLNKAVAELDNEDNVAYVHAWLLDVSHQHYTEKIVTQRLNDALENKRASENFIDMVSHELRNPLSAILQSADGIITSLEATLSQDISKHASLQEVISDASSTIVLCSQHMKCIVDDILTLSKLDSNLLVITPDKAQPPRLIEKVLKMYESELKRTKVEARLEIEQSYNQILHNDDYVMLDPSRMLQVIINLLTNAIKFTQFMEERTIKVYLGASYDRPSGASHNLTFIEPRTIRRRGSSTIPSSEWGDGQEIFLQICVEDTGRGLSAEEISLLFQRFSQASPKTYKQYGGSGLGLFISRELTELQGGQIGVSSKGVGKGSSFSFYIRTQRCGLEDNKEGLSSVALQYVWGTSVIAPAASEADEPPVASTKGRTSLAPEKSRLSRVSTKRRYRKDDKVDQESATQALHVLIVEDNIINQKVMVQQLRRTGCVVHIANHGLECLSFLRKTPFWRPDASTFCPEDGSVSDTIPLSVVLMDWEMPTMDGLACVREIRRLQELGEITSHVPVIGCTANARTEQISIAMEAGMDDLVTKPFRIPDLVPQMNALVAKHSGTSAQDSQAQAH